MSQLNAQEVFEKLGAPFSESEIEWRAQQVYEGKNGTPPKALVVPYVQSRAIMNRLDDVVGWHRWENIVEELPGGGIIQGIRIWLSDTRSITKWDGADRTNIEATKGGISSAFKRAAVLLNIGRYLYSENARWVQIAPNKVTQKDEYITDKKRNISGYFTPPSLSGNNNYQGKQQSTEEPKKNQNKTIQEPIEVPAGMIECTFKGLIDRDGSVGKYLEAWFESNGDIACLYAIGATRDQLLSLNLQEGDVVAVASKPDEKGNFIIQTLVKVAA
ncbi:hypothetical protein IIE26_27315 (plasmid) [Cytobacillus oceanisediminis]|uniref:Rad52/Rad22 family DNA repair protein n=1 Tax=Cytobacillus oceanisediminis TaxID=665099 RepID=UPI001863F0E6|nr:Rad52/Rad22 family DNA repair protein [Cytobacillus oceanisediminis]QOK30080.1 hypothetical protein IIE26_27315 [Cytobacillus oceanisediminis]